MGRDDLRQYAPLVMRLSYEADVAEAEVAQPAMDELRGCARGAASEVACLHERDSESGARGMGRDPGADDAAAHDEQVETALGELGERPSCRLGHRVEPTLSRRRTAAGAAP